MVKNPGENYCSGKLPLRWFWVFLPGHIFVTAIVLQKCKQSSWYRCWEKVPWHNLTSLLLSSQLISEPYSYLVQSLVLKWGKKRGKQLNLVNQTLGLDFSSCSRSRKSPGSRVRLAMFLAVAWWSGQVSGQVSGPYSPSPSVHVLFFDHQLFETDYF